MFLSHQLTTLYIQLIIYNVYLKFIHISVVCADIHLVNKTSLYISLGNDKLMSMFMAVDGIIRNYS